MGNNFCYDQPKNLSAVHFDYFNTSEYNAEYNALFKENASLKDQIMQYRYKLHECQNELKDIKDNLKL